MHALRSRPRLGIGAGILAAVLTLATATSVSAVPKAAGNGPTGTPIVIGVMPELTGPLATFGKDELAGEQLWVDTVGKKKGILGRPIKLVVKDDGGTAATAGAAARELLAEKPEIIVGPLPSAVSGAVLPLFNDAKILNFNTGALAASSDPSTYPFTFNTNALKTTEAEAQLAFGCQLGTENLGIISPNGVNGDALVAAANLKAASAPCAKKLKIVGTERHDVNAPDLTTQIQKLKQAGADTLIVGASTIPDHNSIYRALKDLNWHPWVLTNGTSNGQAAISTADPAQIPKILPFYVYKNTTLPRTKASLAYEKAMKASGISYGDLAMTMNGYSHMELAAAAANGAGSTSTPAMVNWLETHPVETLYSDFQYSPQLHNGFVSANERPVVPGSGDTAGFIKLAPSAKVLKKKYGSTG